MFCWNVLNFLLHRLYWGNLLPVIFATTGVIVGWNRLIILLQLMSGGLFLRLFCLVDGGGEPDTVM